MNIDGRRRRHCTFLGQPRPDCTFQPVDGRCCQCLSTCQCPSTSILQPFSSRPFNIILPDIKKVCFVLFILQKNVARGIPFYVCVSIIMKWSFNESKKLVFELCSRERKKFAPKKLSLSWKCIAAAAALLTDVFSQDKRDEISQIIPREASLVVSFCNKTKLLQTFKWSCLQ